MPTLNNTHDPLANLQDIHLPGEVSGLPLAPGWWLLGLALLALLVGVGWWCYRKYKRQLYRRQACQLLNSMEIKQQSVDKQVQAINALLKRVALHAYPHKDLAGCHGQRWTDFLQSSAPQLHQPPAVAELLQTGPYRSPQSLAADTDSLDDCYCYSRLWIEKHQPEARLLTQAETLHAAS